MNLFVLQLKELKERQKQQLRQKAMKKGLDPEALTGKYPPKIRMYSKYERRTDTRTYEDRRKLYEGGWEVVRAEHLQASWKEKYDEWLKRPKSKYGEWLMNETGQFFNFLQRVVLIDYFHDFNESNLNSC